MEIFDFNPISMMSFLLTLMRVSILLFLLPFFGGEAIPKQVKASLCLVLTWALWPHLNFPGELMPSHPLQIILMLLGEVAIGMALMLTVRCLFAAVRLGGQIIGFQMGFSMINVVDPLTGVSVVITSHFLYMTTLLTFLSLGGHLYLLQALADSFAIVPPGALFVRPEIVGDLLRFAGEIYVLAIKIAAPVMGAIFLVDLALALVGRAAPQMHVLILGFPIKITVGFFFLGVLFTTLSLHVEGFIAGMNAMFQHLLTMFVH